MIKRLSIIVLATLCITSFGARPRPGNWVGSAGIGLVFDGGLFLLSPQVEYIHSNTLSYGGLIQLGLSSGTLVTLSGSARYTFQINEPKIHPFIEGAIGFTLASGFTDSLGVHIMMAPGLDYELTSNFTIGTTFRLNFAPPIDNFFVSWPIAVGRLTF